MITMQKHTNGTIRCGGHLPITVNKKDFGFRDTAEGNILLQNHCGEIWFSVFAEASKSHPEIYEEV